MHNWKKKGLIYSPNKKHSWNQSHAQVPVVDVHAPDGWRIYYSSRDELGRSRTSYIVVEPGNPGNVLYEHDEPILELGKPGTFDDSGIMPTSIVTDGNKKYLYYTGWTQRVTVPFHNAVGLAISKDEGKTFKKFEGPLMSPTVYDPYFTGTAYVMKHEYSWDMWYLSCTGWQCINDKMEPSYNLKYAHSMDGINWDRKRIAIGSEKDAAICGASVIEDDDVFKMWYCYRGIEDYRGGANSYRIGYAESKLAGSLWERKDDEVGIDCSQDGWDSEMMAYPCVVRHDNKLYMFYNGNGFGIGGLGYAERIQ